MRVPLEQRRDMLGHASCTLRFAPSILRRKRPLRLAVILARGLLSRSCAMLFWLADVPGEQVADAVDQGGRRAGEHVADVGFGIEADGLAVWIKV